MYVAIDEAAEKSLEQYTKYKTKLLSAVGM